MLHRSLDTGWGRHVIDGWGPKLALLLLALALLFGPSGAEARYASLVIDARSGAELSARYANTKRYPASLTKIMTLYMVFDALERGTWTMKTRLPISRRASRQPQTNLGLRAGETITVDQAIRALVVRSANDVAAAVGEKMAGTERAFAVRMTRMARKLGMKQTTFRNASGLPNRKQVSTARDMAKLAIAIHADFPQFYHFFDDRRFRFRGRIYRNHNKLLGRYAGTDGIKTGYIGASGFNLLASVKRNGHHLVGVVFGGRTSARRNRHMMELLDKGFRKMVRTPRRPRPALPKPRPDHIAPEIAVARAADSTTTGPLPKPRPDHIAPEVAVARAAYSTTTGPLPKPRPDHIVPEVAVARAAYSTTTGPLPKPRPDRIAPEVVVARAADSTTTGPQAASRRETGPKTASRKTIRNKPASAVTADSRTGRPPRPSATEPTGQGWGIQVGAYSRAEPALQAIKIARRYLGADLQHGKDHVEQAQTKHGTIYRARILDLKKEDVRAACRLLMAQSIPCIVTRPNVVVAGLAGNR